MRDYWELQEQEDELGTEWEGEFEGVEDGYEEASEWEDELDGGESFEDDYEGDSFEDEFGESGDEEFLRGLLGNLGRALGGFVRSGGLARVMNMVGGALGEETDEELDDETFEIEFEAVGGNLETLYQMEAAAERLASSDSEEEADEFLPILAGLATKLAPIAMPIAKRLLGHGIRAAGRFLSNRRVRRRFGGIANTAIRALPGIAARAAGTLVRLRRRGTRVTGRLVGRALISHCARVLGSHRRRAAALRAHRRRLAMTRRRRIRRRPGN
jgi:hypothetical protein